MKPLSHKDITHKEVIRILFSPLRRGVVFTEIHHEHRSETSNERGGREPTSCANLLHPRKLGTPLHYDPSTMVSSTHNDSLDISIHCDCDDPIRLTPTLFQ